MFAHGTGLLNQIDDPNITTHDEETGVVLASDSFPCLVAFLSFAAPYLYQQ